MNSLFDKRTKRPCSKGGGSVRLGRAALLWEPSESRGFVTSTGPPCATSQQISAYTSSRPGRCPRPRRSRYTRTVTPACAPSLRRRPQTRIPRANPSARPPEGDGQRPPTPAAGPGPPGNTGSPLRAGSGVGELAPGRGYPSATEVPGRGQTTVGQEDPAPRPRLGTASSLTEAALGSRYGGGSSGEPSRAARAPPASSRRLPPPRRGVAPPGPQRRRGASAPVTWSRRGQQCPPAETKSDGRRPRSPPRRPSRPSRPPGAR